MMVVAAVAVMAAACGKEERPGAEGEREIRYDVPEVNATTRVMLEGTDYPDDCPFYAWATYNPLRFDGWDEATDYFSQVTVSKDGAVWTADPVCYWPKGEFATLNLFAFSHGKNGSGGMAPLPSGATVGLDSQGIYINNYVVDQNPDNQVDVMVSNAVVNMNEGAVRTNFNHILSVVEFRIRQLKQDPQPSVSLRDFRLRQVAVCGNFSQGLTDEAVYGSDGEQVKGDMGWTVVSGTGNIIDYENLIPAAGLAVDRYSDVEDDYVYVGSNVILPQRTYRGPNDYTELHLEYNVDNLQVMREIPLDLNSAGFREFEPGKKYILSLTVSGKDIISFSVVVDEWKEMPEIHL